MNMTAFAFRLRWLQMPAGLLILLLQRTPVLRLAAGFEGLVSVNSAVILRSAFTAVALGAYNSLAGATVFNVTATPTAATPTSGAVNTTFAVSGATGTAMSVAFTVTGAPSSPRSWKVTGTLPTGLSVTGGNPVDVNAPYKMTVTGTPTAGGSFPVQVTAYSSPGATGDNGRINVTFTITGSSTPTTFALSSSTFTYTGSAQGPTISATPANATFTSGGTLSATNVGSYTATATATGSYSGSNTSLTWSIVKADQSAPVISSATTTAYGSTYTATANSGIGALSWSLGTGSTATGAAINASTGAVTFSSIGTVVIRAAFAGDSNYNTATSSDFTVTVGATPTTFALSSSTFTYTGSAQSPTINATPSNATFTSGGTLSATNVGSYTATATATGNYTGSNNALTWSISKADQSAPVISSATTVALGSAYTATANSGFGALSWSLGTGSTATGAAIDASTGVVTFSSTGTVVIRATFAGDSNHNAATSSDFTLTVGSTPTTFALSSSTFTYTGSAQGPTVSATPSNATFTSTGTSATNVGSYTATATATGNYSGSNASLTWSIVKADQIAPVISSVTTTTYGSSYTATASSGIGTLSWSLGTGSTATGAAIDASTGAVTFSSIGTVVIRATFAGDSNHNTATSSAFTLTIGAAPTTYALSSSTFTYTGSAQGPSINATPANATFTSGGTLSATNVGSYTATATATGNFTGSNTSLTWSIAKASQSAPAISSASTTTFGAAYTAAASSGFGVLSWSLGTGSTATGAAIDAATGAVTSTSIGTVVFKATFAGDSNHNAATSADFTVTISKSTPTITWTTPNTISVGTALSATQLNATASVPGTFTYNPLAGTVLSAGANQTLSVTFTPTDSTNYYSATASTTITVNSKISPTITWSAPAAITYGTALSATQLNATASVPGTFTYNPLAGTVPGAGTGQTLSVAFTPTDTATYNSVTAQTALTVNKVPLTATADNQSRLYGLANPALTITYSSFVNGDTAAALTAPTASTTATLTSLPGIYPITLTGGSATNYTLTLVNGALTVTPRDYSGTYFGTSATGGYWALIVRSNSTATCIAYLPIRHSAIVVNFTVGADGTFTAASTEIQPLATSTVSSLALASPEAPVRRTAAASAFTLTGQIGVDGAISGALSGLGETLTGTVAAATGPAQSIAGLYSATALDTATGATHTIVGASGQAVVVTTTGTSVDGATGTVSSGGQLTATTSSSAQLVLSIDTAAHTLQASMTPSGSTSPVTYAGLAENVTPVSRVVNLSVRTAAGSGSETLIVGYVITGEGSKALLLRGIGPTLIPFGVVTAMTDPALHLYNAGGTLVGSNDDWGGSSTMTNHCNAVGAFVPAANSKDAALYNTIASGAYTFHIVASTGSAGVALAELYDSDTVEGTAKVVNISARTQVGTGENILIAGFVITGNSPKTILIRGLGPTLTTYSVTGALADPQLSLYQGATLVSLNNDWSGTTTLKAAFATVGAVALDSDTSKDAALLVTLSPGIYSAQVSGVANTTGVALAEIFLMP